MIIKNCIRIDTVYTYIWTIYTYYIHRVYVYDVYTYYTDFATLLACRGVVFASLSEHRRHPIRNDLNNDSDDQISFFQRGLVFMTGRIHYYSLLSQYFL
jgi:hypothetical protein